MGGEHDRLTAAEAASVIGWWIEAGVDVAIQENAARVAGRQRRAVHAERSRHAGCLSRFAELPANLARIPRAG